MKIGVLSDTHGNISLIDKVLKSIENVDYIIHAGDFASDAEHIKRKVECNVMSVSGNCDYNLLIPSEKLLNLKGHTIFITHGHCYNVKSGYSNLIARAKELSASIVVFGHTHLPENRIIDNILFFNPGSTFLPKRGNKGTYGILDLKKDNVNGRLHAIEYRF